MKNKKILTSNLIRKRKTLWGSLISVGVTAGAVLPIASCSNGGGDIPPSPIIPTSGTFAQIEVGVVITNMNFTTLALPSLSNQVIHVVYDEWTSAVLYMSNNEMHLSVNSGYWDILIYMNSQYIGNNSEQTSLGLFSWTHDTHVLTMPVCQVDTITGDLTTIVGGAWDGLVNP